MSINKLICYRGLLNTEQKAELFRQLRTLSKTELEEIYRRTTSRDAQDVVIKALCLLMM